MSSEELVNIVIPWSFFAMHYNSMCVKYINTIT